MIRNSIFLLIITISLGCSQSTEENNIASTIKALPCASVNGGQPNFFVADNGEVFLSWVEFINDSTDVLMFSSLRNGQWNHPTEIARGTDWFVNWADFPSLVVNDDWMAAHWLQKSADGTYDYDVRISTSFDDGKNWSPSFIPHKDRVAAEHGFVTMLSLDNGRSFATWLDGRNTKKTGHNDHGGVAMTLRSAEFGLNKKLYMEAELDARVCDCCQTDAALTTQGPVVVYRDRSEAEVRDISIVRHIDDGWSSPQAVYNDNWKIAGCPVNGPAISAWEDNLAVVWFTAPDGEASVKVAFSSDAGANFNPPICIDDGDPLGRVDIEMINNKEALITWMENEGETAKIKTVVVNKQGKLQESVTLVETSAARSSGFPVLTKGKDNFFLAWTAVKEDSTQVKTLTFTIP